VLDQIWLALGAREAADFCLCMAAVSRHEIGCGQDG
jgi:hypothetical protein